MSDRKRHGGEEEISTALSPLRIRKLRWSRIRTIGLTMAVVLSLILPLGHWFVLRTVRATVSPEITFDDVGALRASPKTVQDLLGNGKERTEVLSKLDRPIPFTEIDPFDSEALSWSSFYSSYHSAGICVFDANGDGRLDIYLPQDGENWVRATNEHGVLDEAPRLMSNVLYLNAGTDEAGLPKFVNVQEAARQNSTYVREELLIENYLYPRESVDDSRDRPGRRSYCAVAADFNADGRVDLLVGNDMPGMMWTHPETQLVVDRFVHPINRRVVKSLLPLPSLGMHLLKDYKPRLDLHDKRESSRGLEFRGANSLFLNEGDKDRDGIPEWRDASRESGLEGQRSTIGLLVADFDLDGDLDIYEANSMDMDYWPGGSTKVAGGANQLYLNQLADDGTFTFLQRAEETNVDGIFDEEAPSPWCYRLEKLPLLPIEYSMLLKHMGRYSPEYLSIDGQETEHGEISWAATVQDVNDDGYPDIWVANDIGCLRLHLNRGGKRFDHGEHAFKDVLGNWMTLTPADFNGDLAEDMFVGNTGGGAFSSTQPVPDPYLLIEPAGLKMPALRLLIDGSGHLSHVVFDGRDVSQELHPKVTHSTVLPPDASLSHRSLERWVHADFDRDSLDSYEFSWGSAALDIQNDGRLDLYYFGNLYGRPGGRLSGLGVNPGRLLVNAGNQGGRPRLVDLTAEHHLFNIEELRYDRLESEGYVYRSSPRQNWQKRDVVYSYDMSVWSASGGIQQLTSANMDLTQTCENGRSVVAADLNGDGYQDLILRNMGGYDSMSSSSVNLKAMIDGRAQVLPAHNVNLPSPTNFEPGRTRVFLNQYRTHHWIKVRLVDDTKGSYNRDAIGARVILNDESLRVHRAGGQGYLASVLAPLHYGLGAQTATKIRIEWPDRERTVEEWSLEGLHGGALTISKNIGVVSWEQVGR